MKSIKVYDEKNSIFNPVKVDEKDTNLSYDKNTGILNISSNNPKGFKLGPCINAAGRLESASIGVELFLEEDKNLADNYAKKFVKFFLFSFNSTNFFA